LRSSAAHTHPSTRLGTALLETAFVFAKNTALGFAAQLSGKHLRSLSAES
jgi:hypothetical protein